MVSTRMALRSWILLLALFFTTRLGLADDSDKELRQRALALNEVTGDDPIKGHFKALVKDPAGTKKLLALALSMAKEKDQPFNYNAALILANTAQELKELEAGKVFYRACAEQALKLQSGQKYAQAYIGLLDLLYDHKQFEDCEKVCQEFLEKVKEEHPLRAPIYRLMIQTIAKQGKTKEALKLVDNYIKAKSDDWQRHEFKGSIQREAGLYEEAAKTYEDVLDRIEKDKELKPEDKSRYNERCLYILSGVYVDLKNIDKAADQLKTLLARKPDDPTYNNDLGYIWADHDMHLDEAEKMIRKALEEDAKERKKDPKLKPEEDKDNSAYLDSLGWVLFKKKQYKEAREPLQKAVQDKGGQHIEIYDHLGEVHMALGEKDAAVAVWKKGLEGVGTSKREQALKAVVEKKLKELQK